MKITLDFCQGSNEGKAIYLNVTDEDGSGSGYRIAGGKCWGYINPIKSFKLDERGLEDIIREAKGALKQLRAYNKKAQK